MTSGQTYDAIIIGAGAAGMMCAIVAGQRGRRVLLIDHNDTIGRKILISGGGRCNFTNVGAAPENYLSQNPNFCRSALARYQPHDFIALVEKHKIAYHEKKLGQLFCDSSAREIVKLLLDECRMAGVELRYPVKVQEVTKSDCYHVLTDRGTFLTRTVVVATGGLSLPKLGASGFGYDLARQFGHGIVESHPGLVGLRWQADRRQTMRELAGVATTVRVQCNGSSFYERILFTHHGLSGPAILQASNYWSAGVTVNVNLLPDISLVDELHTYASFRTERILARHLPNRLAAFIAKVTGCERPAAQLSKSQLRSLHAHTDVWSIDFSETDGYAKAEVTRGGVDTSQLSSKTMESRAVPGLFFIGEVVDVTGWLGGYNFQWAWASGHAAGQAL